MTRDEFELLDAIIKDAPGIPECAIQDEAQLKTVVGKLQPLLDAYVAAAPDAVSRSEHAHAFARIFGEVRDTTQQFSSGTGVKLHHVITGIAYGAYRVAQGLEYHGREVREGYLDAALQVAAPHRTSEDTPVMTAANRLAYTVKESGPAVATIMHAHRLGSGLSHRSFD